MSFHKDLVVIVVVVVVVVPSLLVTAYDIILVFR